MVLQKVKATIAKCTSPKVSDFLSILERKNNVVIRLRTRKGCTFLSKKYFKFLGLLK